MDLYELVFNTRYREFEGLVEIDSQKVNVSVSYRSEEDIEAAYAIANRVLSWFGKHKSRVREYAANRDLLDLKNTSWLEEEEEELTAEAFRNKIVLESIMINADASFYVWYGDGGIFWGHGIRVSISPAFRLVEAEMM